MTTDPDTIAAAVGQATEALVEALDVERARVDRVLDALLPRRDIVALPDLVPPPSYPAQ